MTSHDKLHPLEGYFALFERSLRLPHNARVSRKIRAFIPDYAYRSAYTRQEPLPIDEVLADGMKAQALVEQFNEDFANPERIRFTPNGLLVINDFFGIRDGVPKHTRVITTERGLRPLEAGTELQGGINKVTRYLRIYSALPTRAHVEDIATAFRARLLG